MSPGGGLNQNFVLEKPKLLELRRTLGGITISLDSKGVTPLPDQSCRSPLDDFPKKSLLPSGLSSIKSFSCLAAAFRGSGGLNWGGRFMDTILDFFANTYTMLALVGLLVVLGLVFFFSKGKGDN